MMQENSKKEIVFYYESRQNPNGDPGFENQPRLMPDGTIMVTDVRIKRTIRDYAKTKLGKTLFADYGNDDLPVTADMRAEEILKSLDGDVAKGLLTKTFDAPLFGALVTVRGKQKKKKGSEDGDEGAGNSFKITGPLQFSLGQSINQVSIINPTISGVFIGDKNKEPNRTFGKFYSVQYALIKIFGGINPANLGKYSSDKEVKKNFDQSEENLFTCLWNGTTELVTRSKFPQRSVFYIEVEYKSSLYNDLPLLIEENDALKGKATNLGKNPFEFDKLVNTLSGRKGKISKIRIAACDELKEGVEGLMKKLKSQGLPAEVIEC